MCDVDRVLFSRALRSDFFALHNITAMSDTAISASAAVAFFVVSGMLMCCGSMAFYFIFRVWSRQRSINRPLPSPPLPPRPIQEIIIPSIKSEIYGGEICYTCMEKEANTVLLCPNSHTGLCIECARKIMQNNMACPLCRQEVSGMVHLLDNQ